MAFTDRVVEHPGRVRLTNVSGDIYDITPYEGEVTAQGTLLDAANLNRETQLDSETTQAFSDAGATMDKQNDMSGALAFLLNGMLPETSDGWTYFTVAGYFIGWFSGSVTAALTEATGGLYHNSPSLSLAYPTALAAPPIYVGISVVSSSYDVWAGVRAIYQTSTAYRLVTTASRASATYSVRAFVFAQLA